jgi:hypothetical protein
MDLDIPDAQKIIDLESVLSILFGWELRLTPSRKKWHDRNWKFRERISFVRCALDLFHHVFSLVTPSPSVCSYQIKQCESWSQEDFFVYKWRQSQL